MCICLPDNLYMSITGFVVMVITWEFFGLGFGKHRRESREAVLVAVYYIDFKASSLLLIHSSIYEYKLSG